MTEPNAKENDRLETLLRQWGAEEAARREQEAARGPGPRRRAGPSALGRWLPLAAGFLLCAAGALLVVAAGVQWKGPPGGGAAAPLPDSAVSALRADLQQALGELETSRAAMVEAQRLLGDEKQRSQVEADRLHREFRDEKAHLLAESNQRADALGRLLDQQHAVLKDLTARIDEREKAASRLQEALDSRLAAHRKLQEGDAQLAAEVERLRQAAELARAAQQEAEKKLAAVQTQQTAMMSLFEQVYLAAAARGEQGLRARQMAARQSRLIRRGAELRDSLTEEPTRRLFDIEEVLLTRLELLDPDNEAERESFAELLRAMDVLRQIDKVLQTTDEGPAVRAWLIESRLVLAEVDRAG